FDALLPNQPPTGIPGKKVEPYPSVAISNTNPAVVTLTSPGLTAHGLSAGDTVVFRPPRPYTTDVLPPPIAAGTLYTVIANGLTSNSFQMSDPNGATVATNAIGRGTIDRNPLLGRGEINSPLLWLSQRLAKNRERLGVHYMSDSMGSRHLAAALWRALLHETDPNKRIDCPTLNSVIGHAKAEWPTKWP